ncbi:hypothetical protein VKT23_000434 [Stygiomarasmius scandens]|uniref:Uncharacterized protein n=1 Tax=Marasmiellus scandens TaxID=2682957 RepID=A0ABR1K4A3_9AGAR
MSIAVKSSRNPFRNFLQDSSTSSSNSNAETSNGSNSAFASNNINVASDAPVTTTSSNASTSAEPSTANTTTTTSTRTPTPPRDTNNNTNSAPSVDETLNEELPPAYTPGPDIYQGEQTVQYGPARPFQQPPAPAPQHPPPPQHPYLTPHPTGIHPQPTGHTPGAGWSTIQSHVHSQPQSLWRQITDALTDRLDNLSVAGPSSNSNYGYGYGYNGNSHPPQPYAAGPPPSSSPPPQIPDDGRPTNKPVPGHPLLYDGKLLVYPTGFYCEKCHNTGYKHADPSHPCRKCWSKYAKPFKGAITYAWGPPNSDSPSSPTSQSNPSPYANSNFQRPLPKMRPPNSGYSAPPPVRPSSAAGPGPAGYPGASWHNQHPPPSGPPPGPPVVSQATGSAFSPPPVPPPTLAPITTTPTGALNSVRPTSPLSASSPQGAFSPPPGPPSQAQGPYSPPTGPPPGHPGAFSPPPGPPPGPGMNHPPPPPPRPNIQILPPPSPFSSSPYSSYGSYARPPPGGVVYRPGDPRIGGRPCWKCGGDGRANGLGGLFFDEGCAVCKGIGRVF